ncbi:MAG: replication-associated recombination protein A, partial [candidate division Zixibacteria bacterium]|nr:replication-associated recombination protein A [candidate division Zixibacteria bacterium]
GELSLAQAAVYLATAPKSNAIYKAFNLVEQDIQRTQALPVPLHIRNAPTQLMKGLGYGKGYKYPHDFPDHFVDETYLPENLKNRTYYHPSDFGFEKEIKKRLEWWSKKKGKGKGVSGEENRHRKEK